MNRILIVFGIIFFISCGDTNRKEQAVSEKQNSVPITNYEDWQVAKGENIEFKYPKNWRLKIRTAQGTMQFGLTNDMDTSSIFYPVEVWEFDAKGGSFEDFAGAPHEYFKRATGAKTASLMNLSKTKFQTFDAQKFEFTVDNYPVDIITVNGIKKYYMLVSYKEDSVANLANDIFNSIKISTQ